MCCTPYALFRQAIPLSAPQSCSRRSLIPASTHWATSCQSFHTTLVSPPIPRGQIQSWTQHRAAPRGTLPPAPRPRKMPQHFHRLPGLSRRVCVHFARCACVSQFDPGPSGRPIVWRNRSCDGKISHHHARIAIDWTPTLAIDWTPAFFASVGINDKVLVL